MNTKKSFDYMAAGMILGAGVEFLAGAMSYHGPGFWALYEATKAVGLIYGGIRLAFRKP